MMFRQIVFVAHIRHTHAWTARDGRLWIFWTIRLHVDGKPTPHAYTFLLCEDDAP